MPKSVRFPEALEVRLARTAELERVSTSTLIRRAVERYCDTVLSGSTRERLADVIGTVQSTGGRARRSGAAFRRLLRKRRG